MTCAAPPSLDEKQWATYCRGVSTLPQLWSRNFDA
jgi:hypothetical protein